MSVEILVSVREGEAIVRKVVWSDDGFITDVYELSETGEWVRIPEGRMYPPELRVGEIVDES